MNKNLYDAIVVGGGPAGLTSAIYLARAKYRVLVLERESFGGQISLTNEVVNYPGIYSTDGMTLSKTMKNQAEAFGAEVKNATVTELELDGDIKKVHTDKGVLETYSVILATGANPRKGGFEGEDKYQGRGVAYCATCDGEFFTDKEIAVIGGGYAAAEEAVFLTKFAKHVHIFVRSEEFSCAKSTYQSAKEHPKITVHYNTKVEAVDGDSSVREITLFDKETGEKKIFRAEDGDNVGVFVFVGYVPETKLVEGKLDLKDGYVVTHDGQKTSKEGVFAAGDLCIKDLRQVATAVSDGAIAATQAEKYVHELHKKTGNIPEIPEEVAKNAKQMKAKYVDGNEEKTEQKQEKTKNDNKNSEKAKSSSLSPAIVEQLESVFSRFTKDIVLKVYKNDKPVSDELSNMMREMSELNEKVSFEEFSQESELETVSIDKRPAVKVFDTEGNSSIAFHGVPGGHEFQSFVLGLYNFASEGQEVDEKTKEEIKKLKDTKLDIVVSLSCTQCPDLVVASQRLATLTDNIKVDVYDINHFEDIKNEYEIMSVPCIIINDGEKVVFGKKNISELVEILS